MAETGRLYRQGDVLLQRVDLSDNPRAAIDAARRPARVYQRISGAAGPIVLAKGEASGHARVLEQVAAILHDYDEGSIRLLELGEAGVLRHEEHAPITLPPGTYQVIRQREWSDDDAERLRFAGD
jgi:hypothetical protein